MSKRPKPLETFYYTLNDVDLVCELDYSESEEQTYYEPGESENADLFHAFCNDVDIVGLLSESQIHEIELAFLAQERETDV